MTVPRNDTRSGKRKSLPHLGRGVLRVQREGGSVGFGVVLAMTLAFGVTASWAQQPLGTPGVATPGVATPGVAAPGVATPGVVTPGVAAPDAGLDGPAQKTPAAALPSSVPQTGMASPTGVTSGSPSSVDASRYIIGSDDVLQLTVWKEPTLSGNVPVRPDGMISMVLLGDVPATGMTPMQLSANITERLKKYIQDPSVTVVVTAVNSQKIFLIGEVQHVGAITLSPGMTPLQAVSAAGGLTNYANGKRIYILRGGAGKQEKIPFNYKQALKGDSHQLIALHPGDTIVVP